MAIQNRYEFMYYVSCTNANPNGDPDMGNTPRIDPQTMRGYITDVATKRRIRNYVDMAYAGEPGMNIIIQQATNINRKIAQAREGIDSQHGLKAKIKYARKHSIYTSDAHDTYMVSYVGKTDWGGMADYMEGIYSITDGNLVLEVNALPDKFCVCFQLLTKDRKPLDLFTEILSQEQIPFTVSECMVRHMPDLQLPKPENEMLFLPE